MAFSILRAFQSYKAWVDDKPDTRKLSPPQNQEEEVEQRTEEPKPKQDKASNEDNGKSDESGVVFRVQIYQSPKKTSLNSSVFKGRDDIWEYESDNVWKYTAGRFDKPEDAIKLQAELKKDGFADAFVVAFNNNKRITLSEARQLVKN
jgi:hypothetical protein